ncbi:CDP-alcohol phosphatidyltransferase family protein [bacterium]|nr:CDP-alcohol phosphatidyltransferase family protein [bacterium]
MKHGLKKSFARSIKPVETEEPIDLFIFRPIGLMLVMILKDLPISPNVITVFSSITGLASGYFFAQATPLSAMQGAFFLILTNILDCTDGQLARFRGTSSRLGKTLDGIGDSVTYFSITAGVTISMIHNSSIQPWLLWVFAVIALINEVIHIHLFDHFKNELIFYSIPEYHEKLESIESLKNHKKTPEYIASSKIHKFSFSAYLIYYIIEETLSMLAHPKNYKGFLGWYETDSITPEEVKQSFRKNYLQYNNLMVRGWSLLGATAHISVFIIAGLLNRLDLVFWVICVPFNIWLVFLIIAQRTIFHYELRNADKIISG